MIFFFSELLNQITKSTSRIKMQEEKEGLESRLCQERPDIGMPCEIETKTRRHKDRAHRQAPSVSAISTLHAHSCRASSEAQTQQRPIVYRSETPFPQLIRDWVEKVFPSPSIPTTFPSPVPQPAWKQVWRVGQVPHKSVVDSCTSCPQASDLPNEGSTAETSSRMNNRGEQAHFASHITYQANWMEGVPPCPKLPM